VPTLILLLAAGEVAGGVITAWVSIPVEVVAPAWPNVPELVDSIEEFWVTAFWVAVVSETADVPISPVALDSVPVGDEIPVCATDVPDGPVDVSVVVGV
jgi:hypothetical protein